MQDSEWKGSKPQRFSGGRKHIGPEQQLNYNLMPKPSSFTNQGIRIINRAATQEQTYKPHLKVFPGSYQSEKKQIDLRGKKYIQMSSQKQRKRAQKAHISGNMQTIDQVKLRGIKSFQTHNQMSMNQYAIQGKMQRKIRVNQLTNQRNQLSVMTLGDKPYKYPQYSTDFYKSGGLISGSTIRPRNNKTQLNKKVGSVFTKPNWDIKVQMEEIEQQKKAINSVDEWEQTILKQANPNWNDPDTFFERMQAAKNPKDVKKGGKK